MKTLMVMFMALSFLCSSAIAEEYSGGRNIRSGSQFTQKREIFFNDAYFAGQNGFFDVGDNKRIRGLEDTVGSLQRENDDLRQQMGLLIQQLREFNARLNNYGAIGGVGNQPLLPLLPGTPNILPGQRDGGEEAIAALFKARCASCHTEGKAKGGFSLVTKSGGLAPFTNGDLKSIKYRTTTETSVLKKNGDSSMPQGGPPLSEREQNMIKAWVDASTR